MLYEGMYSTVHTFNTVQYDFFWYFPVLLQADRTAYEYVGGGLNNITEQWLCWNYDQQEVTFNLLHRLIKSI